MAAVLLERMDRRVRSEHDVEAAVGVSCIGLTPKIRDLRLSSLRGLLIEEPFNIYAEAIRSIVATATSRRRLPIRPRGARKCAVFAVASSEQVDGKTTLALSFAVSAATLGQRVLLIDLDFRNHGIADALGKTGEACIARIGDTGIDRHGVKTSATLGIDFLMLADRLENSFASMSMIKLSSILDDLRADYDCIVIDSPPLIGATEARAIVAVADNLIFALKWGATDVDTAHRALRQLQHAGIKDPQKRAFGVITEVNVRRQRLYR
jgi:Mrp family chromosome partitioning ATPase